MLIWLHDDGANQMPEDSFYYLLFVQIYYKYLLNRINYKSN